MQKIKPKTALGQFLDRLPEGGMEQQLKLDIKSSELSSTNKRGDSLICELPSGKKIKFIVKLISPEKCRIWKGNIRLQEFLTPENTKDLKEKIMAQGQAVPALARPIKGDPHYSHEIIYGSRRHYVCSSLGIDIKILEADLDDNDALIFMDAENAGREDLSYYEMALAYKFWLDEGIFKSQNELSEKLGITRGWLNKTISLSKIPKEIITAVSGPKKLPLKQGLELVKHLTSNILSMEESIRNAIQWQQEALLPEEILNRLLNIEVEKQPGDKVNVKRNELFSKVLYSNKGDPVCKITDSKQGKTIVTFNARFPRTKLPDLFNEIELLIKKSL